MNNAIDVTVKTLALDIAKSVCKFKLSVGGLVAKLEDREVKGEELDQRLRVARENLEHTRALLDEPVDLSDIGYVLSSVRDEYHIADLRIDTIPPERLSHLPPIDAIIPQVTDHCQPSSKNQSCG